MIGRPASTESFHTRLQRWGFNLFPAYRGTGGHLTFIAADWTEVRLELPLNWRTRNYVGTIFGGSMYGAVDPIYMLMLIKRLGPDYVIWDKEASIRFRRPGRATLYARFVLHDDEVAEIRSRLDVEPVLERSWRVELTDRTGTVHAVVDKLIHIRRKRPSTIDD